MSLAPLNPIQMLPARDRVAAALREAILSHQFAEGEELTLKGTAAQLGVSSTPIREAFQMLARDPSDSSTEFLRTLIWYLM